MKMKAAENSRFRFHVFLCGGVYMSGAVDRNKMDNEVWGDSIHKIKADSPFLPFLYKIDTTILSNTNNHKPFILAIDGLCGSGKTSLAKDLRDIYDCNVFHMDDFYLPFDLRTNERLEQSGGNVHYERFYKDVLIPILRQEPVTYIPFQCSTGNYGEPTVINHKNINIVEGSYSLHPALNQHYDCKVFLTVNEQVQIQRIRKRSGEEKLQQFINKWIPLENKYINELQIQSISDLVMDTSNLW